MVIGDIWKRKNKTSNIPPCDVRLYKTQHLKCCLVDLDKGSVVDLSQTQQLQNLLHSRTYSIDTTHNTKAQDKYCSLPPSNHRTTASCSPLDSHDKGKLGFC